MIAEGQQDACTLKRHIAAVIEIDPAEVTEPILA